MPVITRSPVGRVSVPAPSAPAPVVSAAERRRRTKQLLDAAHATDDPAARSALLDEVILLNRCVAEAIARRYRGRGVSDDDLQQSAFEGLVKAVRRFDPDIRSEFLIYAVPTIRGEVRRWFRDQGWMVRPPRRLQEMQWKVNRGIEDLEKQAGREPTVDELAAHLRCSPREVDETLQSYGCFRPASLDHELTRTSGRALADLIADAPGSERSAVDARVTLAPAVRRLSERDRQIIYLRFFEDRNQREIAAVLGISQVHVSRLLRSILRELQLHLAPGPPQPPPGPRPA
jgi:RNA polymerase sigma-B factor